MTSAISKLLTALCAATFLAIAPVSAQQTGTDAGVGAPAGGGTGDLEPTHELDQRVSPEHRTTMMQTWRGLTMAPAVEVAVDPRVGTEVPVTVARHPVPQEIVTIVPDVEGYEYYAMPDGRIVIVDPQTSTIAMVLD